MRKCIGCGTKLDPNDNKEYIYCTAACANHHVYHEMGKKQRHSWLDSLRHYWRSRLHSWRDRLYFWLDTLRDHGWGFQAAPKKIKEPIDFIRRVEKDISPLPPAWKEIQALAENIEEEGND